MAFCAFLKPPLDPPLSAWSLFGVWLSDSRSVYILCSPKGTLFLRALYKYTSLLLTNTTIDIPHIHLQADFHSKSDLWVRLSGLWVRFNLIVIVLKEVVHWFLTESIILIFRSMSNMFDIYKTDPIRTGKIRALTSHLSAFSEKWQLATSRFLYVP